MSVILLSGGHQIYFNWWDLRSQIMNLAYTICPGKLCAVHTILMLINFVHVIKLMWVAYLWTLAYSGWWYSLCNRIISVTNNYVIPFEQETSWAFGKYKMKDVKNYYPKVWDEPFLSKLITYSLLFFQNVPAMSFVKKHSSNRIEMPQGFDAQIRISIIFFN